MSKSDFFLQVWDGGRSALRGSPRSVSWADEAGYQTASGAALLTLRRGDKVYLYVEEGEVYEPSNTNRGYATFSGHRIG